MLDPTSPVRVAGVCRIEEGDMVRAYEQIPALRNRQGLLAAAFFGLLAAVTPVIGLSSDDEARTFSYFFVAVGFAGLAWFLLRAHYARGKRQWAALEEWHRQVRFELTDTGFRVRTERTSSELDWGLHGSWLESEDAFYVQAGATYHIVPKRAFETEEEIATVRELLRDKIVPGSETKAPPNRGARTLLLWVILIALMIGVYALVRN